MHRPLPAIFLNKKSAPTTGTLMVLAGLSAMTLNMFLPSLPSMAEFFQTTPKVMQLSVSLFLALNGVLQIIIGPMSDRYGRRPVLITGFVIFLIATMGCILSQDIVTFLVFRCMQVSIVVAMVLSRAVIRDLYPQDQAASRIGYVTMGMAVVPMLTPALGGWLDENFGWQAVFWAFMVAGLAGLLLVIFDVGETNTTPSSGFRQQFREYPELLMSPRFWGYALCAAFTSAAFFTLLGGGPFIASEIFELSPKEFGAFFGIISIGYIGGNFLSGRFATRAGINALILSGTMISLMALLIILVIFLTGFGSARTFFGFMILLGLGNGLVMPNAIAGSLSVRPQLAGTASGLGGALMIGGGAAWAALAGATLDVRSGVYPLLYIQLFVASLAIGCILLVIRREKRLALVQQGDH